MILEIDTEILNQIPNISISQLVFLNLLQNVNQHNNQDIELFSRFNIEELKDLEAKNLICIIENTDTISYELTEYFKDLTKPKKEMFDEFYEQFPVYVIRADGTKAFLRSNVNKCRHEYNKIVGRSKAMHQHILNCLKWELDEKTRTGKLGYMKTMWKWLTQHEWEVYDEAIRYENNNETTQLYGTEVI